ncbi:hypothetical protein CDA63_04915 [Hymenobacter amundsenii]|uniref:WG repeat-containing protein n=1 Tax=Hymenobacter amundsenii TaxID=2006685 RepID=A0A246FNQ7_9BACT|nr:WG repeat-containing protein [Hymenobacter amundsenii]OWP64377.1 hypothetical protein CDA63_04915 [Hymenobacter amundsenii]
MKFVLLLLLLALLTLGPHTYAQSAAPEARLVPFRQGNQWGYADHRRRLVLPARYDEAGPFADELAWVRQDSLYGYIDGAGNPVTPVQFSRAGNFHDNRATVRLGSETFDIGPSGQRLPPSAEDDFDEDPLEQGDVVRQNGKVGFRFTVGAASVPVIYDEIRDNYHGLLFVRQGNQWGVINGKGKLVQAPQFDAIELRGNLHYPIVRQGNRFGYLTPEGATLTDLRYLQAEPFFEGVARVQAPGGRFGYLDEKGREFWSDELLSEN